MGRTASEPAVQGPLHAHYVGTKSNYSLGKSISDVRRRKKVKGDEALLGRKEHSISMMGKPKPAINKSKDELVWETQPPSNKRKAEA